MTSKTKPSPEREMLEPLASEMNGGCIYCACGRVIDMKTLDVAWMVRDYLEKNPLEPAPAERDPNTLELPL